MIEKALPNEAKSFSFYVVYFFASIFINLFCVPLHEGGHAIIYLLQGYKVSFHFTKADPIGGTETILGSAGGVTFNILLALLFLFLFIKYKNILFYMLITALTLFIRVIPGLISILMGRAFEDETFIGNQVHVNPLLIEVIILAIMASILIIATKALINQSTKKHSKYTLIFTIIACIISIAVIVPLDANGV